MIYAFEQLGVRDALNAIGEGLKPDSTKLMTARAWGGALLHVRSRFFLLAPKQAEK